jgi:hypothetical protein
MPENLWSLESFGKRFGEFGEFENGTRREIPNQLLTA